MVCTSLSVKTAAILDIRVSGVYIYESTFTTIISEVETGKAVIIAFGLANHGTLSGTGRIQITANGTIIKTIDYQMAAGIAVTTPLGPGVSPAISSQYITHSFDTEGTYEICVEVIDQW